MPSGDVLPVNGGGFGARLWNRELVRYPELAARRYNLFLVVAITVALYYELYVGGGVAPLILGQLQIPFPYFVLILAFGNLAGAFASLLAGLTDRMGRANLVVIGLGVVSLITLFVVPSLHSKQGYAITYGAVAFVEGIILVATPALIRDFSPQVGRATAMGFWTVGPVLGSLMVSLVTTYTLPLYGTWQSQYVICGIIGLAVFVIALFSLRELAPALRDQLMVSERDRLLVELKAKGLDIESSLRNPWLLHRRRLWHHLPHHRFWSFDYRCQRCCQLGLGHQRHRAGRGRGGVGQVPGAQTLHAGGRHRRRVFHVSLSRADRHASLRHHAGAGDRRAVDPRGLRLYDLDGEFHGNGGGP